MRKLLNSAIKRCHLQVRKRSNEQKLIDKIEIASPCPVSWESMAGDERVRFCSSCKLNVYNIAEFTPEQTTRLIGEKEGNVCIQLYRRADGTVLTQDCPSAVRLMKRAFLKAAALTAGAIAWIGFGTPHAMAQQDAKIDVGGGSTQTQSPSGIESMPHCGPMRGRIKVDSIKPIITTDTPVTPAKTPEKPAFVRDTTPQSGEECGSFALWRRMLLGLAAVGTLLASFRLLKERRTFWLLGIALGVIFIILGFTW